MIPGQVRMFLARLGNPRLANTNQSDGRLARNRAVSQIKLRLPSDKTLATRHHQEHSGYETWFRVMRIQPHLLILSLESRKMQYCIGAVNVFEIHPDQQVDFDSLREVGDQRLAW